MKDAASICMCSGRAPWRAGEGPPPAGTTRAAARPPRARAAAGRVAVAPRGNGGLRERQRWLCALARGRVLRLLQCRRPEEADPFHLHGSLVILFTLVASW
ncbi:hypothetical protein SETIT_4G006400v2 [Setaria italica]|uniref:Uncharacterized protein n=1 Tax=Setaria italica TaxID=4555 RepID=A0A368QRC9_SETIT|nr:hypothetical protein SETIT_4G006400v2 [Setaria italica]